MTPNNHDFLSKILKERDDDHSKSRFHAYETPLVTVDVSIFSVIDHQLKVLLIKRSHEPFIHQWALPGGFIRVDETLKEAAERRLYEETHVEDVFLQQIRAFGKPGRDPRGRIISIGFYALVSSSRLKPEAHDTAEEVAWFDIEQLPELAFDHQLIVDTARLMLQESLEETPVAFQLLPERFTLTELQRVYELIEDKILDKRNFRKKILATGLLVETGEVKKEGRHRPAMLYRFAHGMPEDVEVTGKAMPVRALVGSQPVENLSACNRGGLLIGVGVH